MVATRKLEVQITGEDRSASRAFGSVDDAAGRTESTMSKWSTRIAGAIGAAFAVDTILDWGSTLINAAEEAQKVAAQTEAVLTSMGGAANMTADDIADLAEAISLKTGLDDEMIQSGENVLLTFGNIRNEVGENNDIFTRATEVATDMSVALGQDLQSSVVQVGKALNDPIAGLSALSRVGVQFTEDQKNMITMLVAAGDTLGAQKVILEELERQFTGSAEAQATTSDKLKVAWDNVVEQLGTALLPTFEKVATWLAETLPGAIETATGWIDIAIGWIKDLSAWYEDNTAKAQILAAAIAVIGVEILIATAPVYGILIALLLLGAGLYYAYQNWGWFRSGVEGAIDILMRVIGWIRETIGWIDKLSDKLAFLGAAGGAFGAIGAGTAAAGGGIALPKGAGRNIPKGAEGGFITRPTFLLAGEAGPEALIPLDRGMGMGGNTYVTVNVDGSVLTNARQLIDVINEALATGKRLHAQGRGL